MRSSLTARRWNSALQEHRRKAAYHQEKAKGSVEPVAKRDPAAPAPTPKPPKVGSLPKPPKPPKPKATQAGVSVTSVTMKGESGVSKYRITTPSGEVHEGPVHGSGGLIQGSDGLNRLRMASENHPDNGGLYAPKPGHVKMYSEWTAHGSSHKAVPISGSKVEMITKSEPTAILDAARVDAEVERRLAAIEEAREGLEKADTAVTTPIAKSESDHVKEFVLGLDLGGTRRWHSACVSKDDSNLGRAIKGKQADRTYSREGSRGVPGICTGCGGELQMDPAPREVDAPAHGEDHNEHKIEKAEGKTKMPKYVEGRGWTGGEKDRLYHLTDKRTGQKWVKDVGNMRGVGPEVEVRHATRAEAEEMHQKPLHPGWKVSESVEKGYDEVSKEWVHGHLRELSQRADEHQKAGRKADADAMREKIKIIKEKHGMGPAPTDLSKGFVANKKNAAHLTQIAEAASQKAKASGSADDHEMAAGWHGKAAVAHADGDEKSSVANRHMQRSLDHWKAAADAPKTSAMKSELLAGARHHYARVVRFQQLGKSEDATKSAAMCALYVERLGADPAAVPDEVRNCGPVNLQKASFHLDREVRGLPAKMLPLIKATIPNFGSSVPDERDQTPVHGHKGLGLKLMNWHSSGSDPIYGTGSTFFAGKPVPKWQVQATLDNISKLHSEAQTPEGVERGGWGPADVRELGGIKNHLMRLLKTPKTPVQKALTGAPGDMAPGAAVDGGALQMSEDAKHGAKEVCAECKQPISYHQHSRKWNHTNAMDSEKSHQNVRIRPEGWASAWHKSVEKSEKSDVIGQVGKGGGKPLDIGDGYHVHAHGYDANGNHSVWVSKGANRARKIQSGGNLPSVHSQRGAGDKGKLPITRKIAEEIKDYHRQYHEKPTKKSECAPAGSPLEKLNAMIKSASSGASLSKATIPNFSSSLNEDEQRRDETPIIGHKDLGLKLMNWHSSGSDPVYGTGSTFYSGKPVPRWQVQATLDNISKLHREAQTPEGAQRGGWGPADVRELGGIKNHLTRLLKMPKASIPDR